MQSAPARKRTCGEDRSFRHCSAVYVGDNKLFLSTGPTLGALVLASTVTVIILLGAFESDEPTHQQTYLTQYHLLHLYETFLVSVIFPIHAAMK